MNKSHVREKLIQGAREQLKAAQDAHASSASYKNDPDMRQEGKYDTRSIEAGQLAGAQARRVEELKLEVQLLEELPDRVFEMDEEVGIGALVRLSYNSKERDYFISPTAGGTMLEVDGAPILVISVFSPLGHGVMGMKAGESFEVGEGQALRLYQVLEVR